MDECEWILACLGHDHTPIFLWIGDRLCAEILEDWLSYCGSEHTTASRANFLKPSRRFSFPSYVQTRSLFIKSAKSFNFCLQYKCRTPVLGHLHGSSPTHLPNQTPCRTNATAAIDARRHAYVGMQTSRTQRSGSVIQRTLN